MYLVKYARQQCPLKKSIQQMLAVGLWFLFVLFWTLLTVNIGKGSTVHEAAKNVQITSEMSSEVSALNNVLEKRDETLVSSSKDKQALPDTLTVAFEAYDKKFKLKLKRLEGLIHPEAQVTTLTADSEEPDVLSTIDGAPYVATSISANDAELTEIHLARFHVSEDRQVTGGFEWQGALFRLRPRDHPILKGTDAAAVEDAPFVVTRDWMDERKLMNQFGEMQTAGNRTVSYRCGHDLMDFNKAPLIHDHDHDHEKKNSVTLPSPSKQGLQALFAKRAEATTGGCQGKRKVLYIGIAADSLYMQKFSNSRQRALQNILTDFALVSAVYERSFNVELGILSIVLLDGDKAPGGEQVPWNLPCTPDIDIGRRLNEFSKWRSNQSKQIGLFHLVSGCSTSEVVGIAWINQVCNVRSFRNPGSSDTVSGTSVSVLIPNQYSVIAHEIGHNFGAIHDCDKEACRQCKGSNCECCTCGTCDCRGQFVMHPESGGLSLKEFSECSKGDICSKIPVLGKCLQEPGKYQTIKAAICGNGIVEDGEECDCGSPEECKKDPCCQEGCKLRDGAQCADGNHACCKDCQVRGKDDSFVCARAGPGQCQFDSKCDGVHPECPAIQFAPDGSTCELAGGKCASGVCTSRDLQCRAIGRRLGITRACSSTPSTCKLSCETGNGKCALLDAAFLDGTTCGKKGICQGGVCSESTASSFATENAPVVVIAGALVGALAFILLLKGLLSLRNRSI